MNREKMSQHDSNKFDLELEFEYSKKPNYYLYFAVFLGKYELISISRNLT